MPHVDPLPDESTPEFTPRFLKRYFDFHNGALDALKAYKADVEAGSFPGPEHSY